MIRNALIAILSALGLDAGPQQEAQPAGSTVPHPGFRASRLAGPELSLIRFSLEARTDGRAQLGLTFGDDVEGRRGDMSGPWDWSDLRGVSREALTTAEGPVAFMLDSAAGDLACSGVASAGIGAGRCEFDPDEAFAATLAARVSAQPSTEQLFHLALTNFDPGLLDVLEAEGYARPDLDQVIGAAIHRVDAGYVRDVARSGYRLGALDDLVAFRMEDREIGGSLKRLFSVNLRHDVPDTDWAWGFGLSHQKNAQTYRLTELSRQWEMPIFGSLFVEHKDVMGLTVRASAANIFSGESYFNRTAYAGRRLDPISYIEVRDRTIGPIFNLELRDKF